jgi:hypothetical protein
MLYFEPSGDGVRDEHHFTSLFVFASGFCLPWTVHKRDMTIHGAAVGNDFLAFSENGHHDLARPQVAALVGL